MFGSRYPGTKGGWAGDRRDEEHLKIKLYSICHSSRVGAGPFEAADGPEGSPLDSASLNIFYNYGADGGRG